MHLQLRYHTNQWPGKQWTSLGSHCSSAINLWYHSINDTHFMLGPFGKQSITKLQLSTNSLELITDTT